MKKMFMYIVLGLSLFLAGTRSIFAQTCTPPSESCPNTDFSNSYLNSSDPASIEYDNMVSTLHSTIAREADGKVYVWGENMSNNGTDDALRPQLLNRSNFNTLTGSVLKFTGGSQETNDAQFAVLTTTGLFLWGEMGNLVSTTVKNTRTFQKVTIDGQTNGLPLGVTPSDVKMLFGSYKTLAITTCYGDVWMLSDEGSKYGNGLSESLANSAKWHKVKTNSSTFIGDIVATRGFQKAMFALKGNGTLWTWGERTYLGDGTNNAARPYATQMTLPPMATGVTPKMIGMTGWENYSNGAYNISYFVLLTDGKLYSLGQNADRQLGDFSTDERKSWVQVKKNNSGSNYLENIVWISPQEHDRGYASSMNALSGSGDLWAWGANSWNSIGFSVNGTYNPTLRPGGLSSADKVSAVETGGHTTIIVKECSGKYGYVGHRINGSMGDGRAPESEEPVYNFTETAVLNLCSAPALTAILKASVNGPYCTGNSVSMIGSPAGGTYSRDPSSTASATINPTTGAVTFGSTAGELVVNYTANDGLCGPVTINKVFNVENCGYKVIIPGNVWEDTNKDAITDAGENGLDNGFWANLIDPEGYAIASARVNSNGTFSFTIPTNKLTEPGNYSAILTNSSKDIGEHISTADNPLNSYLYTGTNRGGAIGADVSNTTGTIDLGNLSTISTTTTTEPANFGIYNSSLPVRLINFGIKESEEAVELSWSTTEESNSKGYRIERSSDSRNWQPIGFVSSQEGESFSKAINWYNFTDQNPPVGLFYYRLKMIDLDDTFAYSRIINARFTETTKTAFVYPNPATDFIKLSDRSLGSIRLVEILDAKGTVVYKSTKILPEGIPVSHFINGMYLLKVTHKNGIQYTHKVIVNKLR
jgi:alpha-tubulin suppressor-like RCC1 family protein